MFVDEAEADFFLPTVSSANLAVSSRQLVLRQHVIANLITVANHILMRIAA